MSGFTQAQVDQHNARIASSKRRVTASDLETVRKQAAEPFNAPETREAQESRKPGAGTVAGTQGPRRVFFCVPGIPPKTTAQQKGACAVGKGVRFFKKGKTKDAERLLFSLLEPFVPSTPFQGPLRVRIDWNFPWRESDTKAVRLTGKKPHWTKPDLSNLVKMMEDVMTEIGFWEDDGQIFDLRVTKHRGEWTGFEIEIQELDDVGHARREAEAMLL
jgi:Holliday junction resolvase RusA-like endonuclease